MAGKKLSQAGKSQVTLKLSVPNCKKENCKEFKLKTELLQEGISF
jgi:hypothetical protein